LKRLRAHFEDPHPSVRYAAVKALSDLDPAPYADVLAERAKADSDAPVREAALDALGRLAPGEHDEATASALAAGVVDPDRRVVRAALRAVAQRFARRPVFGRILEEEVRDLPEPTVPPALADRAARHLQVRELRLDAALALAALGDGRAWEPLLEAWRSGQRPEPVRGFATLRDPRAGRLLLEEIERLQGQPARHGWHVAEMLRALADIEYPPAASPALRILEDSGQWWGARAAAALLLASQGRDEARTPLIRIATSPRDGNFLDEWQFRRAVVASLGHLGGEGALEALVHVLRRDPQMTLHAIVALERLGDPRAVPHLEALIHTESEPVARRAALAVERLRSRM
jgi:HEAT repeat protein